MPITLVFWLFPLAAFVASSGVWMVLRRTRSGKRTTRILERAFFTTLLLWGFLLALLLIRDLVVEPTRTSGRVVRTYVAPGFDADRPEVYVVELQAGNRTTFGVPREAYAEIEPGDTVEIATTDWIDRVREVTILEGAHSGYHAGPSVFEDAILAGAALVLCPVITAFWGVVAVGALYGSAELGRVLWRRARDVHT